MEVLFKLFWLGVLLAVPLFLIKRCGDQRAARFREHGAVAATELSEIGDCKLIRKEKWEKKGWGPRKLTNVDQYFQQRVVLTYEAGSCLPARDTFRQRTFERTG